MARKPPPEPVQEALCDRRTQITPGENTFRSTYINFCETIFLARWTINPRLAKCPTKSRNAGEPFRSRPRETARGHPPRLWRREVVDPASARSLSIRSGASPGPPSTRFACSEAPTDRPRMLERGRTTRKAVELAAEVFPEKQVLTARAGASPSRLVTRATNGRGSARWLPFAGTALRTAPHEPHFESNV